MREQFVNFMASTSGRITRVVGGMLLIAIGLLAIGGTVGVIVALIGLVPLFAGAFDFCVFAPPLGYPFSGKAIRGETEQADHH